MARSILWHLDGGEHLSVSSAGLAQFACFENRTRTDLAAPTALATAPQRLTIRPLDPRPGAASPTLGAPWQWYPPPPLSQEQPAP